MAPLAIKPTMLCKLSLMRSTEHSKTLIRTDWRPNLLQAGTRSMPSLQAPITIKVRYVLRMAGKSSPLKYRLGSFLWTFALCSSSWTCQTRIYLKVASTTKSTRAQVSLRLTTRTSCKWWPWQQKWSLMMSSADKPQTSALCTPPSTLIKYTTTAQMVCQAASPSSLNSSPCALASSTWQQRRRTRT